jgi:hypothetical protein
MLEDPCYYGGDLHGAARCLWSWPHVQDTRSRLPPWPAARVEMTLTPSSLLLSRMMPSSPAILELHPLPRSRSFSEPCGISCHSSGAFPLAWRARASWFQAGLEMRDGAHSRGRISIGCGSMWRGKSVISEAFVPPLAAAILRSSSELIHSPQACLFPPKEAQVLPTAQDP